MDAGELFFRSARTLQPSMSVHPRQFFLLLDVCLFFPLHYYSPPQKKYFPSPNMFLLLFLSLYFPPFPSRNISPPFLLRSTFLQKHIFSSPKILILFLFKLIDTTTTYHIAFNFLTQVSWRLFVIRNLRIACEQPLTSF